MHFGSEEEGYKYLKKVWVIYTSHHKFKEALEKDEVPDDIEENQSIVCRGEIAKQSADYNPHLCKAFWDSVAGVSLGLYVSWKRDRSCKMTGAPVQGAPALLQTIHAELPFPVMITQSVPTSSKEEKSPLATAAVKRELEGHSRRGTWGLTTVREHYELMNDPEIEEVALGRGFDIMGINNTELQP